MHGNEGDFPEFMVAGSEHLALTGEHRPAPYKRGNVAYTEPTTTTFEQAIILEEDRLDEGQRDLQGPQSDRHGRTW